MTNALDELRKRVALGTPEAAAASEAEGRAHGRVKNGAAPWFRYITVTGTLKDIQEGRTQGEMVFANLVLTGLSDIEENPKYNAAKDTLPDGVIEVKLPDPGKGIQRQWEPTVLMVESARAHDASVKDIFNLMGRKVAFELTVEFIENRDGTPAMDKQGYQRETWYYKVNSLGAGGNAPAAKPDAANVAVMAASLYGQPVNAADAGNLLKWMTQPSVAMKDAPLQKLVVDGKFVAHAEAEGLLASAEGVFYDPTANSQ